MPFSRFRLMAVLFSIPFAAAIAGCSDGGSGGAPKSCPEAASEGVRECIGAVNAAWEACYSDNNAPCASDDAAVGAALATLQSGLEGACSDGEFLSLTVDALVGRLQNSCRSEADALAWRTWRSVPGRWAWRGSPPPSLRLPLG
ncbi:MAG: hypothetical protein OEV36_03495 [Myxococcales bacterium]|nr:hypothetical protein [Myxococcales bacterium]